MTSGLLRMVVAKPADSDGLTLLVLSSACQRGSGGPIGAGALAAAGACATPAAGADAACSWPAHGAGPGTSTVSYLITSTGHPSAATMIEGVSGFVKSGLIAGGRMRHVVSWTSKTSGQSFSHASQTMHPGAIQTLTISWWVSAISTSDRRDAGDGEAPCGAD